MLVIVTAPAEVSRCVDEKAEHHEEKMQAVWPEKDELRFVLDLLGPIDFSELDRDPHDA